jgi:hypothetical protein
MPSFTPLVSPGLLLAAGAAALALAVLPGPARALRLMAALVVIGFLAGPRLPWGGGGGAVTVLVDRSPSARAATAAALAALLARLEENGISAKTVVEGPADPLATATRLAPALAGLTGPVVILTDGHIHDAPPRSHADPVSIALTAPPGTPEVRVTVLNAPARAPPGSTPEVRFQATAGPVVLTPIDGGSGQAVTSPFLLPPLRPGPNGWALSVKGARGKAARATFVVEGAQERARVLLLTGRAHPGARAWREALRADPALDVTQFALLRTPAQARAARASGERRGTLALASVPSARLFRPGGLAGFDLVVLDAWGPGPAEILPPGTVARLAAFVEGGGGLIVSGQAPEALAALLPGAPAGPRTPGPVLPEVVPNAATHPILAPLMGSAWGPWIGTWPLAARPGSRALLKTASGSPLLLLTRRGQGRVAQVGTDGAWAWSRGYAGGGPFGILAQHIAGWALGNPALTEGALAATPGPEGQIIVTGGPPGAPIEAISPHGDRRPAGRAPLAFFRTDSAGLWTFTAPGAGGPALAVIGSADPPEWRALAPDLPPQDWAAIVERSGGRITWLGGDGSSFARISGSKIGSALSPALALLLICALLAAAWWAEQRKKGPGERIDAERGERYAPPP